MPLDIVFLADLRFPGGTSTALIHELLAARAAGLSMAVAPIQSAMLMARRPPNSDLQDVIARLAVPILPAQADVVARLALIYHPSILNEAPTRRFPFRAERVAVVAHDPLTDRAGRPQFDLARLTRLAAHHLGHPPLILPVGPKVRRSFEENGEAAMLWSQDWHNLIDPGDWPQVAVRAATDRFVIGRHSRPDLLKWPELAVAAQVYPADPAFEFRMLGVDDWVATQFEPWPGNWTRLPFCRDGVKQFLAGLDAYAYYHHPKWIEAFGYTVLEALASGLPVVLPPDFRELFGDAALYADPADAAALYEELRLSPALRERQGALARQRVAERFGLDRYGARFAALMGCGLAAARPDPALTPTPLRSRIVPRRPDRVMVVTSNGVGVGHLARQLAIARNLPTGVQAVFFSLSRAVRFAAEQGFCAEYRPFHRQMKADVDRWNQWFAFELTEAIAFYRPEAVVFDGNMPYTGLITAMHAHPGVGRVWVRRAMWRYPDEVAAQSAAAFHLVITPREVCSAADPGHDLVADEMLVPVPPILSMPAADRLSRAAARRLLGLPEDGTLALLQLGAGSNFDMSLARETALDALRTLDCGVVELVSPARAEAVLPTFPLHHIRTVFPAFLYQRAFDFSVSAVGYNAYHEIIAGALPSLLVPNTAPEMDLQEVRADYAARAGWALTARADDIYALRRGLARIGGDTGLRTGMAAAMTELTQDWTGAAQAAQLIALVARTQPRVAA